MNRPRFSAWPGQPVLGAWLAALVLLLAAPWQTGCAARRPARAHDGDVSVERKRRHAELSHDLERRRNQAQFLAASFQWQQGETENCRDSLRQLLARDPAHRDGCLLWAEVCLADGCPEKALPLIEELSTRSPQDVELANCLAELGASNAPTVRSDGNDSADSNDGAVALAAAALRENDPDRAIELLVGGEGRAAETAESQRILGLAYYRKGDLPAARDALSRSVALDNGSALSYFLLGSTLARLGDADAAQWHLSRAGELDARFAAQR
jgi:tetratricopeptide (TPR) repeat protein